MATFMGSAWVDLRPGADVEAMLRMVRDAAPVDEPEELYARVVDRPEGPRVQLSASGVGYQRVADSVVMLMRQTDIVRRAFVALDHDEYGAECVVLGRRDGVVCRAHHGYLHPRRLGLPVRIGKPWRTDVPPAVPPAGGRDRRGLVAGSAAWAATAELYGVSAERVRQAARAFDKAHGRLQVVAAPFEAWLDTLSLPWVTEGDGRQVRLRPGPAWAEAVTRYALPDLPEGWFVGDDEIIMQPVGLIARGLLHTGSSLSVILHPLYLPIQEPDLAWQISHDVQLVGTWPRFATAEDGQPSMRRMVEAIHKQVLPHFDRYGSPAGYRILCQELNSHNPNGIGDPHVLHRQALTEIILDRPADAVETLSAVRRVARTEPRPPRWLTDLAAGTDALSQQVRQDPTAARAALLANVTRQHRRRRLPPDR